jgi:cytochrome c553
MIQQFAFVSRVRRGSSWLRSSRWVLFLGLISLAFVTSPESQAANNKQVEIGRRIYMEGMLPSGKPLQGKRANSVQVEGAAAACETCHRRSGMGSLEGNIVVPPITGRILPLSLRQVWMLNNVMLCWA